LPTHTQPPYNTRTTLSHTLAHAHTRSHTLTHAHTRSHTLQSEGAEARSLGLPGRIDPDRATGVDFADRHVSERARMSARDHTRAHAGARECRCIYGDLTCWCVVCECEVYFLYGVCQLLVGPLALCRYTHTTSKQAMNSWLQSTKSLRAADTPRGTPQHAVALRQLHALRYVTYGVAMMSMLLKNIGLFCRISSLL